MPLNSYYRPDIDGLRAVAVLSVLFYHAGIQAISGGYVGVDIFFVISGFLITSIIVREIEEGTFSIARFYERRFRRILPALVVVIIVSLVVGVFLLHPEHLRGLGKSAIATSVFSSNILFYLESGYFDGSSEFKPLLHTWSLAVEEQYYIFFPILMILIARVGGRRYAGWLIPLALISFIVSVAGTAIDAAAAFYLIPSRAWELFIGSILALNILPHIVNKNIRELLSVAGILCIIASLFYFTSATPFPGWTAAMPTLGTALIIYAGSNGQTYVSILLRMRPVVFIGLISYSLYLWHWPVIVYLKYYSIVELSVMQTVMMLLLVFVLSVLSWRYVETPFRKKSVLADMPGVFKASAAASVLVFAIGTVLLASNGMPERLAEDSSFQRMKNDSEWFHWGRCEDVARRIRSNEELCNVGVGGEQTFIVWGDSHAKALASAIDLSAKRNRASGAIATRNACPPLLKVERENRLACNKFNQVVLRYISEHPQIDTVFLVSRWAISANGTRYKREKGKPVKLVNLSQPDTEDATNMKLFETGLRKTVDQLLSLGKKVVIVNSVPEVGYDVPSANFVARLTGRDVGKLIAPTIEEYIDRNGKVTSLLSELSSGAAVRVIEPVKALCDDQRCAVVIDGVPVYRDDDHLSTYGAKYISKLFDDEFSIPVDRH